MSNDPLLPDHLPVPKQRNPALKPDMDERMELVFDPFWLIQVLFRHRIASVLIFCSTVLASLFLFLKDPPQYVATSKLKIEPKRPIFTFEQLKSFELFSLEYYTTQVKLLQSRSLVREVINEIGIDTYMDYMRSKPGWISSLLFGASSSTTVPSSTQSIEKRAIDNFLRNLKVSPDRTAPQIISLVFTAPDAKFAAQAANTLAEIYIRKNTQSNVVYTDEYIENVKKLIEEKKKQIDLQNDKILNFKKEHGFFQIQGMSSYDPVQDIDDRLSRVRKQMDQANREVTQTESNYEFLFDPQHIGDMNYIREEVIESPSLQKLRDQKNDLLQIWAEIKDKYLERHPEYVRIKSKLDAVNDSIQNEIAMHVQRAKSAYDEAVSTQKKLVNEEQILIQEKYSRDKQWNELKSMEKTKEQLEQQRVLYLRDFQNASSSLDTQQQTENRTFEIVDRAEPSNVPSNRRWLKIILLTLAAALSLTLSGVLLIELQDQTIRTPQQLEQISGISVMGCIPQFKCKFPSSIEGRITPEEALSPAGESFIALRTRFLFSDLISDTKTILITSTVKNEGKSTVAVNLASSLTLLGKKVVLLDCDLRKPSLHRFFGDSVEPGISDIINNTESLDHVLFETDMPGLYLIPAGSYTQSPSEILTSPSFDELLEMLRDQFDFIFLDSPSVLATPDPTILSPRIDMSLLVVRSGIIAKDDLLSAINHFTQTGSSVYATILNGVPPTERSAYSRYGYGYSKRYQPDYPSQSV